MLLLHGVLSNAKEAPMADVTFRRGVEANLPTSGMATEGCVYLSTDTGNMYVGSSQGTLIPVNRSPYYGACTTQASTNAKVVTLDVDNDNFTMKAGVMISVLFSNANTAASPTLNVNNKGAVAVKSYGTTNVSASPRAWEAGEVVTFVHNGSYWMMVGHKVQSDWNQTDNTAVDFIKNKPTNVSVFTNDAGYITTNDIPEGAAASTTTPKMDGAAEIGTELAFARGDHRHPSDTSKQDKLTAGHGINIQDIVEVEYIESTGTQYINTGIVINDYTTNVKVDLDFKNNETSSAVKVMWGFTGSGNLPRWGNFIYTSVFHASANSTTTTSVAQDTSRHIISSILHYDNGVKVWSAYVDGVLKNSNVTLNSPTTIETNTLPIFLFARNNNGTAGNFISTKIYSFSVEKDGQQIANLIPVRVGSVGYMYDTVSGRLFGNDGDGDFLIGPDVRSLSVINFVNDDGFITSADLPTNTSDLTNDSGFITLADVPSPSVMTGATSQEDGASGLVPQPLAGQEGTVLSANGTWVARQKPTYVGSGVSFNGVEGGTLSSGVVRMNFRSGTPRLNQNALVACADSLSGMVYLMVPLTQEEGIVGNKTPNYTYKFPIGSKIYYNESISSGTGNSDYIGRKLYSSHNYVDARYTAVTGSSINLSSSSASGVFLRVNVDDGYWSPYYKSGNTTEIIVTSDHLISGNFYIYLGKTSSTDNSYTFQLEENNPLYYFDGTKLIPYSNCISQIVCNKINLFDAYTYNRVVIGNTNKYTNQFQLSPGFSAGQYKVTLQMHVWWDNGSNTLSSNLPLAVTLKYNSSTGVLAGTYVIPVVVSPNQSTDHMGTVVVNLIGFVTFSSQQTNSDYLELYVDGKEGMILGGDQPLYGDKVDDVSSNDYLMLEKMSVTSNNFY